jgi:hypothetical protein
VNSALWATAADRERIARARSAVLMVGGYDGAGNFGDVLQLAAALRTVAEIEGAPLPIAVIERGALDSHAPLLAERPELFDGAAFAHFTDSGVAPADGLDRLEVGAAPAASALLLYGGGYLNRWWGARKAGLAAAAERLSAAAAPLPLIASGLQVEGTAVAPGGPVNALLSRASLLGARDIRSLELMRGLAGDRAAVELVADDAIPLLAPGDAIEEATVNVHLNAGDWVGVEPRAFARFLCEVGREAGSPLALRPVIAYEDPRVSETAQIEQLLHVHCDDLRRSGLRPAEPVNALADVCGDGVTAQRRARLTISCSYHVALTSLLAGIPTVLLAENGYYDQKAAGLRHLFDLEPGLVGVGGTDTDASAAAAALRDGETRERLTSHLRRRAPEVVALQARGRERVAAALGHALQRAGSRRPGARSLIRRLVAR